MDTKKTKRINLRLTEEEFETLSRRVNSTINNRLSDYLRRVIFQRKITVLTRNQSLDEFMQELIQLKNELNSIGNNFNQIVKKINSSQHCQALSYWLPLAQDLQKELLHKTAHIQDRINEFSKLWLPS